MNKLKLFVCDKYGWPVTRIKGRWILNFFRKLIYGRKLRWWILRPDGGVFQAWGQPEQGEEPVSTQEQP